MPLDEREKRILAEIERQFYEEDPDLVHAVRKISKASGSRNRLRLAILGLIAGVIVMLATFRLSTWIALAGFALIVLSTTTIVQSLRRRDGLGRGEPSEGGGIDGWVDGWRGRFRFRRR